MFNEKFRKKCEKWYRTEVRKDSTMKNHLQRQKKINDLKKIKIDKFVNPSRHYKKVEGINSGCKIWI